MQSHGRPQLVAELPHCLKKQQAARRSVATIGAATTPRRGPIPHSRNSWCLKERTIVGHASSPKMRRAAAAELISFIFGSSGHCFRDPLCPGYAAACPGENLFTDR